MKACFALSALVLTSLLFVAGCGQSSTRVSPSETPSEEQYEADFQEHASNGEGKPAKQPATANEGASN